VSKKVLQFSSNSLQVSGHAYMRYDAGSKEVFTDVWERECERRFGSDDDKTFSTPLPSGFGPCHPSITFGHLRGIFFISRSICLRVIIVMSSALYYLT
jgi:hypothetical protein